MTTPTVCAYLSIGWGVSTPERARNQDQHLLVLQIGPVVLLHAHHLGRKHTPKHILDHVSVVLGAPGLRGVQYGGLHPLVIDSSEHAHRVPHHSAWREASLSCCGHSMYANVAMVACSTVMLPWLHTCCYSYRQYIACHVAMVTDTLLYAMLL